MNREHVQLPAEEGRTENDSAPRPYGPRTPVGEPRRCRGCTRRIPGNAKRHVCARCACAETRGRTVDGPCAVCGEADRRFLALAEIGGSGRYVVLCGNDERLLGKLRLSLEELRAERARVA